MLRVQGLPATLTAFITSMAVLFQSAMTSARTGVLAEIRARPTIATFSTFIVASLEKWDFRTSANVVWMYLRNRLVVRAASAPVTRKRRPTTRGPLQFRQVIRSRRYLAKVEPVLGRVRCRS